MPLYNIDDIIVLHDSDRTATIKGIINENSYLVVDDAGEFFQVQKSRIKKRINTEEKKVKKGGAGYRLLKPSRHIDLSDKTGEVELYMGFEFTHRDIEDGFIPYLVNKSGTGYEVQFSLNQGKTQLTEDEFNLPAYKAVKLRFQPSAVFTRAISIKLHLIEYFTDGSHETEKLQMKIKPSYMQAVPSLDKNLMARIIKKAFRQEEKTASLKLKEYAKGLQKPTIKENPEALRPIDIHDPGLKAHFQRSIDLHINELTSNPEELTPQEAFRIQMDTIRAYLDEAYQLGISSVTVIHGKGKGRLRREIEQLCRHKDTIQGCQIDYNYGSMEVYFRE